MPLTYDDGKNYFSSQFPSEVGVYAHVRVKTRSGKTWEDSTLRLAPQWFNGNRYGGAALLPSGIALKDVASVGLFFSCGYRSDLNAGDLGKAGFYYWVTL